FFFQAEDGIRDFHVTGVQTCALPISRCWTNSTDCPKYGLRCIPFRKPSTTCRAFSSSLAIREIASGCKNLLESWVTCQLAFLREIGRASCRERVQRSARRGG